MGSVPAKHKSDFVMDDTSCLVRNFPLRKVNKGEDFRVLLCVRNLSIALTGQVDVPVLLMRRTADRRNWSVFDDLMRIVIDLLFNVMSLRKRWQCLS